MKATMYVMTVSLVAAALAVVPGANAQGVDYAALEYTVIMADAADHVGFLDIREIAFAEPGDGSLVARFVVQDFSISDSTMSLHLFMTTPAGSFRAGVGGNGNPSTHSSSAAGFDSCLVDGSAAYCVISLEALEAGPGDILSGTYAITYEQAAQDFAPGGYFESSVLGNRGDDYTIIGAVAQEGPALLFGDLDGAAVDVSLDLSNATNDTYVYNWSRAAAGPVEIGYQANLTAGNVSVLVEDGANNTILEAILTAAGEARETVVAEDAADGNWTITVAFSDAMGRLSLTIANHEAPPVGNETMEPANGTALGNETTDEGGLQVPGFETMALVVAGAIAMAFVSRRRR